MRSIALYCLLVLAAAPIPHAAEAAITRVDLNIPRQPLDAALDSFSQQTRIQVARMSDQGPTVGEVGPLRGAYEPKAALEILLKDSGLGFQFINDRMVRIYDPAAITAASTSAGDTATSSNNTPAASAPKEGKTGSSDSFRLAQVGPRATESAASGVNKQGAVLEEVVVTAQKRQERLLDTPQSVSVLSAQTLANIGATQFRDFASAVPGLNFQTAGAGNTQITLRGVTTGFDVTPTTGIYVDEVPYGSTSAFAQGAQAALDVGLFDLDRIEVLRGPQGTLYGAATMGGLIKYVTSRPDTESFGGSLHAGVSGTEHGAANYNFSGALNVPLVTGKAALRASTYETHDGGYIDNVARGDKNVNRADIYGGRLDLLLTPIERFSLRIAGFLQNISRDGESTADYTTTGAKPYGDLDQNRPFAEPFRQQFRLASVTASYEFGPATLTSISSYQSTAFNTDLDISVNYIPLLNALPGRDYGAVSNLDDSATDKVTQEIRLASGTLRSLDWVVGAFYTHESSRYAEQFVLRYPNGAAAPNDLYTFSVGSKYEEYAGFGDLTWHLTSRLSVTGGLRYAHNDQSSKQFGAGLFIASLPLERSNDNVKTYLANVRYAISDLSNIYVRYATGYRPGGPNLAGNDPSTGQPIGPPTFQADRLKSYEAGYKAESGDHRFSTEVAIYYIDWNNMQVLGISPEGFACRQNLPGGAAVRGAELTLTAKPMAGLAFGGSFAYQNAKLVDAAPAVGGVDGERLPDVPRFTGAINADYVFIDSGLLPSVGVTARYVSDRMASFNDSARFPQYRLPAYTTIDLRSGITVSSVELQIYVHNLSDRRGQLSDMSPQYGTRIGIIQPRTIGLNASMKF